MHFGLEMQTGAVAVEDHCNVLSHSNTYVCIYSYICVHIYIYDKQHIHKGFIFILYIYGRFAYMYVYIPCSGYPGTTLVIQAFATD